jgi:crotonobetainyl-CoA:carnitine CoA-transferase CaiB-like acyl-CoA transferase
MSGVGQALDGLRVVEFGGYAAGPHIGKMLANFGATVVHVESRQRPDGFRLQYPPFKDGRAGTNRGGCFTYFNDSKYAITLDLKNPDGLALGRRLCDWSDVVVENMRPGVMERLGLGYAALSETHDGLIMLSTCNMGQTGPRADTPGFGSQLSALAGFCGLTGFPDGSPMLLYGPYVDFIASIMGTSAVLAALDRRHRTGRGGSIDISQYECGLAFMAGALLDYRTTGRVAQRCGNDDAEAAPHGAYRCRDGHWLALSCWSDEEFAGLARTVGDPALAWDPRFIAAAGRRSNRAELDRALNAWCETVDAEQGAIALQSAGVPAYRVTTMSHLFDDPQLVHRRTWRKRRHAVIGDQAYYFPGFDLPATPGDVTAAGPLLGADNERVFREFLGLDANEYAALESAGAFA